MSQTVRQLLVNLVVVAFILVVPPSLVGQEGPWDREWEEVPPHRTFPGMDEGTVVPPEIRFRTFWDREAAPIQKWHTFHLLMLSEPEDRRFRRFSTTLIHCADRLLLEVREAFIEDEEIGHDEGLQRDLWGDRVQTLLREDQTKLRESFEGWEVDGEAVCAWLTGGG